MYGVTKTNSNRAKNRISFDSGQNMIHRVSHWKEIRTAFHRLPLAKRFPSMYFPKKLNASRPHFVETYHTCGANLSLCCTHTLLSAHYVIW